MRLITRPLLAVLLALCVAGIINPAYAAEVSENPYVKSYVSKQRPGIALQPDADGPKIYSGKNQTDDYNRMLENGFDMLGYSSFQGPDVAPEKAAEHAKNIKADLVLLYTEQKGSTPAGVQLEQARKKMRDAAKQGEEKPAADDTAVINSNLYEYFASYWVKLAPPLIGVHVQTDTQNEKRFGLRVIAVVKESPAAKAAIQEDDVITRVGDVAMDKPEALSKAAQRYAGQTVEVLYKRGDNEAKTSMTLNNRN